MKRTLVEKPKDSQNELLYNMLEAFNKSQPGYVDSQEYSYVYYDENEKFLGGITFEIHKEWVNIDTLVVEESNRRKGYGKIFLKDAEEYAKSKGCTKAYLYTYVFQAPKFYEKYGYRTVYLRETKNGLLNKYQMVKDLI